MSIPEPELSRGRQGRDDVDTSSSLHRALITEERAERFRLLLHLLENLREPLILSGPEGIGKSLFLNQLVKRAPPEWLVVVVNAAPADLYGQILVKVLTAIGDRPARGAALSDLERTLSHHLHSFERSERRLVLGIDDAGMLPPEVFTEFCRFARFQRALYPVFSMRPDQLFLKSASDPAAVEDAHVLEIPPLAERQCGEFLHQLVSRRQADIPLKAITPMLVADVYRESHGVPGAIVRLIPRFGRTSALPKRRGRLRFDVYLNLLLLAVILLAIFLIWRDARRPPAATQLPIPTSTNVPGANR